MEKKMSNIISQKKKKEDVQHEEFGSAIGDWFNYSLTWPAATNWLYKFKQGSYLFKLWMFSYVLYMKWFNNFTLFFWFPICYFSFASNLLQYYQFNSLDCNKITKCECMCWRMVPLPKPFLKFFLMINQTNSNLI